MHLPVCHLVDWTTPDDAFDIVRVLLETDPAQRLVVLGHRSTARVARLSRISDTRIQFLRSAGWADPTGWRALRKFTQAADPLCLHAWGAPAAIAMAACRYAGCRIGTFTEVPEARPLQFLRFVEQRFVKAPIVWTATQACVAAELKTKSTHILPPCTPLLAKRSPHAAGSIKEQLGIEADDGPVVLVAGVGRRARADLALWTGAILQHLFPRLRTIVREDPRGQANASLERLAYELPDQEMLVLAPWEVPWAKLAESADLVLMTSDEPVAVSHLLHAIAAGVPIVAAPSPTAREFLEHGVSALVAGSTRPREIAAQVETLLGSPEIAARLVAGARAKYPPNASSVREVYGAIYGASAAAPVAVGSGA